MGNGEALRSVSRGLMTSVDELLSPPKDTTLPLKLGRGRYSEQGERPSGVEELDLRVGQYPHRPQDRNTGPIVCQREYGRCIDLRQSDSEMSAVR